MYQKGATGVGLGEHNSPRRAWGPRHALVSCAHQVGPLWYLFARIILKYSIKNPREVSAHLELWKIDSLT